tara:strand:+ start:77832 stop:79271 length:1440 start_codon:yes stop_codon:yes gene_type:complete
VEFKARYQPVPALFALATALLLSFNAAVVAPALAQQSMAPLEDTTESIGEGEGEPTTVAATVDVDPDNSDEKIASRLDEIFGATGWFVDADVRVDGGVAFLRGVADTADHRQWAERTTMNTTDVVAVVNRLSVTEKPFFDFTPAIASIKSLARETTALLPLLLIACVVAALFYYFAVAGARLTRWLSRRTITSGLLRQVSGSAVGVLIFVIGIYIALRVSGLTRLAVTLLGGTGLVGLALGFAFRDIAENYLASILISLNNPFRVGDLVEVDGHQGFVRKVTTRGTVLNTVEGNQVQIPNSNVYKGTIINYTATPMTRRDFLVGIGFEDSISEARALIDDVFQSHTAVADDPTPLVLVDSLGSATVNLRCQYWLDQSKHSAVKVTSSLIRQVTQRLVEEGITMPDEARELIFPQGVPVRLLQDDQSFARDRSKPKTKKTVSRSTEPEGDLSSERAEIERVTEAEGAVENEANLLEETNL